MRDETDEAYWARQLSFATVFGALVFVATFLGGCVGFISYFNYASGKPNTPTAFFRSLGLAVVLAGATFGIVLWRGRVRRKLELATPDQ